MNKQTSAKVEKRQEKQRAAMDLIKLQQVMVSILNHNMQ